MAEVEINSVITFSDGTRMDVQSTVDEIEGVMRSVKLPNVIPVVKVVDASGREIGINLNHVREYEERT